MHQGDYMKQDFHNLNRDLYTVLHYPDIHMMISEKKFNEFLFLAFMKADKDNIVKLSDAFPYHSHTFKSYKNPLYFLEDE